MWSGRAYAQHILQAYTNGADGVLILRCDAGDCHYHEGNCRATERHRMSLRLLSQFGIHEARYCFERLKPGNGLHSDIGQDYLRNGVRVYCPRFAGFRVAALREEGGVRPVANR